MTGGWEDGRIGDRKLYNREDSAIVAVVLLENNYKYFRKFWHILKTNKVEKPWMKIVFCSKNKQIRLIS